MNSNLPPGVTSGMIERMFEEGPCAICGLAADDCVCPECPRCGSQGDPKCYRRHGLKLTAEQVLAHAKKLVIEAQQRLEDAQLSATGIEFAIHDGELDPADYGWMIRKRRL